MVALNVISNAVPNVAKKVTFILPLFLLLAGLSTPSYGANERASYTSCLLMSVENDMHATIKSAQKQCKKERKAILRRNGKRAGTQMLMAIDHQAESLIAASRAMPDASPSESMEIAGEVSSIE